MKSFAIIVAGGTGQRFGSDIPKQFIEVKGVPLFVYSVRKFAAFEGIWAIVLVVSNQWRDFARKALENEPEGPQILFAEAGATRQHSVWNGLRALSALAADGDAVFVHDAVRPLFPVSNLSDGLEALATHDAALPVISVKDATYQSADGSSLTAVLPRSELYSGQSPECLRYGEFVRAHSRFTDAEIGAIRGCSELAFRAGLSVKLIPGIEQNFKITTKEDLQAFTLLV